MEGMTMHLDADEPTALVRNVLQGLTLWRDLNASGVPLPSPMHVYVTCWERQLRQLLRILEGPGYRSQFNGGHDDAT
jgi:hypothetical protein